MSLKVIGPETEQDTIKRIERHIEQPPATSKIFEITPAVAKYIIEKYNIDNRPPKLVNIARYAEHMAAGTWAVTGDTIKFSDAKRLSDGQNRLMACVRSGVPFTTHVVFGIDDRAFAQMDQGKKRGGSDVLAIAGYSNTTDLAAAVRWAYLIEEGRVKTREVIEPDRALALIQERYDGLAKLMPAAAAIHRQTGQPRGLVAALLFHFAKHDRRRAEDFQAAWADGSESGRYSALGKLKREIGRLQAASSGRVHDVVRAALIVRAWNVFVEGRKGTSTDFIWLTSDEFPAIKG